MHGHNFHQPIAPMLCVRIQPRPIGLWVGDRPHTELALQHAVRCSCLSELRWIFLRFFIVLMRLSSTEEGTMTSTMTSTLQGASTLGSGPYRHLTRSAAARILLCWAIVPAPLRPASWLAAAAAAAAAHPSPCNCCCHCARRLGCSPLLLLLLLAELP